MSEWVSEWVIVVKRQLSNFSAISWWEQVNFQRDDDEFRFVLDQYAELDFYSASPLKQKSAGRHVAPLGHIILIPTQPVFALTPSSCVISGEATTTNFYNSIVFGLTRPGLELTIYHTRLIEMNASIVLTICQMKNIVCKHDYFLQLTFSYIIP
jgi:hypothetical protein